MGIGNEKLIPAVTGIVTGAVIDTSGTLSTDDIKTIQDIPTMREELEELAKKSSSDKRQIMINYYD